MEWVTLSGGVPCLSLISLGTLYKKKYYISDECLLYLDEITNKLNNEDPSTRPLRRALGFMDIINKDLIPILINSKDQPSIFRATIKLLVGLTVPVECLVCVETSNQSPTTQNIVHELTQLLYNAKESFLDPRATRAVLDHLNRLLEKQPLSSEDSDSVNHSLLLIRNILHAPERPQVQPSVEMNEPAEEGGNEDGDGTGSNSGSNSGSGSGFQHGNNGTQTQYMAPHSHSHGYAPDCSQQNRLLWNLFAQGLDRLLIQLLGCSQKDEWVVTIVQLIALFYKDQHVENMQKLLGSWLNTTTSDSSEDDESNTSPPMRTCNSPQILTSSSDPTSDSSDSAQRNASVGVTSVGTTSEVVECESKVERTALSASLPTMTTTTVTVSSAMASSTKQSRNKLAHKVSASSAGPGGDTASHSSNSSSSISSQLSISHSNKSGHSSQHSASTSSGFHSPSTDLHVHAEMDTGHNVKDKSSKRRCHSNLLSRKSCESLSSPSSLSTTTSSKEEPIAVDPSPAVSPLASPLVVQEDQQVHKPTGKSPHSSTQPLVETGVKRTLKGNQKTGKNSSPEKEQRRKKLIKRSRSMGHIKMKAIVQYTPTEEDISQLLKEFTVDFLLNGYNTLVGHLHQQLLHQDALPLDKSHFLWLITYFLRFASQLELDIEHLNDIFSIDLLCYLTWEAVRETEHFEMSSLQPNADLKPCLRRLHLGVTAIREYLQALETYSRLGGPNTCSGNAVGVGGGLLSGGQPASQGGPEDKIAILRGFLPAIKDLRQVFLLLLRLYNSTIQSRRYLCDVITANHVLLLTLERAAQHSSYADCFDLRQHLGQFCSRTILSRYGVALEDFKTNGPFVNDCILTILHHIGADLNRADLLCEPIILRSFSKIWEEEFNMCDDWDDLIEYVVQKFLRNFQNMSYEHSGSSQNSNGSQSQDQEGSRSMEPESQNHSSDNQADRRSSPSAGEEGAAIDESFSEITVTDIESLKGRLLDSGFQKQLDWIQSSLLTLCAAQLGIYSGQEFRYPIACLSLKMNVPCPMVPWTEVEALALRSELFLYLLHRLGLLPVTPQAGLYPRIPREWSTDALYSVALFFGPVEQQRVDFDLSLVNKVDLPIPDVLDDLPTDGTLPHPWLLQPYLGPGPSTSLSAVPHHWLDWVEQSGSLLRSAEITSHGHNSSNSISMHSGHRPLDSISTTSSLEVHKTDSSDDEDMDEAPNTAGCGNEQGSSSCSMSMEEGRPEWMAPGMARVAGDSSGSDEPFEMTTAPEQSTNTSSAPNV